jgi:hypothetical protein
VIFGSVRQRQRRSLPRTSPAGQKDALLPGLDIEIVHRRSPGGNAEQISINLQAVRFVESANLFAFWAQAVQMAWLPWRSAAQALLPPGLTLP